MKIDPKMKVSEIYRLHPAALSVLVKYRIDLCCGGQLSLEEVARKHGLEPAALLEEISEALRAA